MGDGVSYTVEFHPGKGKDRYYLIDGEREIDGVPITSVTTILKEIGDKFGPAAWWGQGNGVDGTLKLRNLGLLPDKATKEIVVPLLTKHKLTTNHVRDAAGDRGTSVHVVAQAWADGEERPGVAANERPFVEAFDLFLAENKLTPIKSEVLVGSKSEAYAGTYDLEARFSDGSTALLDYKTKTSPPKGKAKAYEQHHLQLTAYEMARVEMGMDPTDFQAVVNLYPNGTYAVITNRATFHQWIDCLGAYRALSDLRESLKTAA